MNTIALPCSEGDIVWKIGLQRDTFDDVSYPIVYQSKFKLEHSKFIGKTIFLTEKEAREELKNLNF